MFGFLQKQKDQLPTLDSILENGNPKNIHFSYSTYSFRKDIKDFITYTISLNYNAENEFGYMVNIEQSNESHLIYSQEHIDFTEALEDFISKCEEFDNKISILMEDELENA